MTVYSYYYRKPILPIQLELGSQGDHELEHSCDVDAILSHAAAVTKLKDAIFKKAKKNIDHAQDKDKMYYDQKHADKRVSEVLTVAIYSILGIANTSVYLIDFLSTLIT